MGLLRQLLTLPVQGPIKGVTWVGRTVHDAAQAEMNNPKSIKEELLRLEAALLNGSISEEDYDQEETRLLIRLSKVSQ